MFKEQQKDFKNYFRKQKTINRKQIYLLFSFFCFLCSVFLVGCASLPIEPDYTVIDYPEPEKQGVYHKVGKGETVWRIAKAYDVTIDDIIRTNNIPDVAKIERNQLVFIPGAHSVKEIILDTSETEKDFIWPVKGKIIRYFNQRSQKNKSNGIRIKAREGQEVKAARSGRIVFADFLTGYGNTVIIDHEDTFYSVYANNYDILVNVNDYIHKGDTLGHVGSHNHLAYLHFEVRRNDLEKNPLYYLP